VSMPRVEGDKTQPREFQSLLFLSAIVRLPDRSGGRNLHASELASLADA
jgi:hypothetical protein